MKPFIYKWVFWGFTLKNHMDPQMARARGLQCTPWSSCSRSWWTSTLPYLPLGTLGRSRCLRKEMPWRRHQGCLLIGCPNMAGSHYSTAMYCLSHFKLALKIFDSWLRVGPAPWPKNQALSNESNGALAQWHNPLISAQVRIKYGRHSSYCSSFCKSADNNFSAFTSLEPTAIRRKICATENRQKTEALKFHQGAVTIRGFTSINRSSASFWRPATFWEDGLGNLMESHFMVNLGCKFVSESSANDQRSSDQRVPSSQAYRQFGADLWLP